MYPDDMDTSQVQHESITDNQQNQQQRSRRRLRKIQSQDHYKETLL